MSFIWAGSITPDGFSVRRRCRAERTVTLATRPAFLGVRSCDLHAIAIQDRVLAGPGLRRPATTPRRREDAFIVAVICSDPAAPASASPWAPARARSGLDLALTELLDGDAPLRSSSGRHATREVRCWACSRPARPQRGRGAASRSSRAPSRQMGRQLDTTDIRTLLYDNARAPALGRRRRPLPGLRQLHDGLPDLLLHHRRGRHRPAGRDAERTRVWDSCFTARLLLRARRQRAQHGRLPLPAVDDPQARDPGSTSSARRGCVGCGRCITWCPVGIDITEEAAAIRADRGRRGPRTEPSAARSTQLLTEHPFFAGLDDATVTSLIAGCAANVHVRGPTSTCSARASRPTRFFVVRHGRVALDVHVPGRRRPSIDTVDDGRRASAGPG